MPCRQNRVLKKPPAFRRSLKFPPASSPGTMLAPGKVPYKVPCLVPGTGISQLTAHQVLTRSGLQLPAATAGTAGTLSDSFIRALQLTLSIVFR